MGGNKTVMNKRDEIQKLALKAHKKKKYRSTVALSVSLGKSLVAIQRMESVVKQNRRAKIVFSGARMLYLSNFKAELKKFDKEYLLPNIHFCSSLSLKHVDWKVDMIVIDESHKMVKCYTEQLKRFLKGNAKLEILCLTGTPVSTYHEQYELLQKLAPISIYRKLNDTIKRKIINDYRVFKVYHGLDDRKNIYVDKPPYKFWVSEVSSYERLRKKIEVEGLSWELVKLLKRLLLDLPSKRVLAKYLLKCIDGKTLIYAGSIKEAEKMGLPVYHSKQSKDERDLIFEDFKESKIKVLVNVDSIKESVSIPDLKNLIIFHAGAKTGNLEQMIGRALRLTVGEKANIYILIAKGTIEETWTRKALGFVNHKNIFTYDTSKPAC